MYPLFLTETFSIKFKKNYIMFNSSKNSINQRKIQIIIIFFYINV